MNRTEIRWHCHIPSHIPLITITTKAGLRPGGEDQYNHSITHVHTVEPRQKGENRKAPQILTTKLSFINKTKEPQTLFVDITFFPQDFKMVFCVYIFLNFQHI